MADRQTGRNLLDALDGECACGWPLPLEVVAFPAGVEPSTESWVPGAYVSLVCPECQRGHSFINALDSAAKAEMDRQLALVKRRQS
jgi:hypothetical protein